MDELLKWLPALLAAASAVVVVKFSEWRHERHEQRLAVHDTQLAEHTAQIAVLEDRAERTDP